MATAQPASVVPPTNTPEPVSELIGREEELRRQPRADRPGRLEHFLHLSRRRGEYFARPPILLSARAALFVGSAGGPTQRSKAPRRLVRRLDLPAQQRICRQMQKHFWQNPFYVHATTCWSSR